MARFQAGQPLFSGAQISGPYQLPDVVLDGYAYPPPSVLAIIPFAAYPLGLVAWTSANVWVLLTGLMAVVRRECGRCSPFAVGLILLTLGVFLPFTQGVAAGNMNVGLAGVLAWAWSTGRTAKAAGGMAGVGAILKLLPGVLVFWSERRAFLRTVSFAGLILGVVMVGTLPIVGTGSWFDFATALRNSRPDCAPVLLHTSIACLAEPVVGIGAAKAFGIFLSVALGVGALFVRSRIIAFSLVGVAWLAPVSDMHPHYFLIVYVVMVAAVAALMGRRMHAASPSSLRDQTFTAS